MSSLCRGAALGALVLLLVAEAGAAKLQARTYRGPSKYASVVTPTPATYKELM